MSAPHPSEVPRSAVSAAPRGAPAAAGIELGWRSPWPYGWLLLGALIVGAAYLGYRVEGRAFPWPGAFAWVLTWLSWLRLGSWLHRLVGRYPAHPGRRWWRLAAYLAGGGVLALLLLAARIGLEGGLAAVAGTPPPSLGLRAVQIQGVIYDLYAFCGVVVISHATHAYRRFAEREVRSAQSGSQLAATQLRFLRAELHPHFLFNSLHMISALLHADPERADRMLADLSELLRRSFETAESPEVPLEQEVAFVERYLALARERFGPRLAVRFELAPEVRRGMVPNLLLQPLVENAIQHGVAPVERRVEIRVAAERRGGRLLVCVEDDGAGLAGVRPPEGIGLANTRLRLAQLYGPAQRLTLAPGAPAGARVEVEIPYRPAPAAAGALAEEALP